MAMRTNRSQVFAVATVMALVLLPLAVKAWATRPLGNFTVKDSDGSDVSSQTLASREKWLLLYVEPGCQPCESVFRVLKQHPPMAGMEQKLVVVVKAGSINQTKQLASKFEWIPESCWYSDLANQAGQALHPTGAPMVYGIRNGNIEWTLAGSLNDAKKLESILMTWCEGNNISTR